jgi:5-methylcytosine-specific restriction endonuclease McrA
MLSHLALHDKALVFSKKYLETENLLLELLGQIDEQRVYLQLGYPSLYMYCLKALGLSESQSYSMTAVSRKCREVPELQEAIESGKLTVSKAKRILPALQGDGQASYWIDKAATLPQRQVEQEVAQRNPEKVFRERIRPVTVSQVELRCTISFELEKRIERARQVLSQEKGKNVSLSEVIEAMTEVFLVKRDPIEKAKRAKERELKKGPFSPQGKPGENIREPTTESLNSTTTAARLGSMKVPDRAIPAQVKHAVQLRDSGRCRHLLPGGDRCESRQFLRLHHVVHFEDGGESTLENLILLCSNHHQRVHALGG